MGDQTISCCYTLDTVTVAICIIILLVNRSVSPTLCAKLDQYGLRTRCISMIILSTRDCMHTGGRSLCC